MNVNAVRFRLISYRIGWKRFEAPILILTNLRIINIARYSMRNIKVCNFNIKCVKYLVTTVVRLNRKSFIVMSKRTVIPVVPSVIDLCVDFTNLQPCALIGLQDRAGLLRFGFNCSTASNSDK